MIFSREKFTAFIRIFVVALVLTYLIINIKSWGNDTVIMAACVFAAVYSIAVFFLAGRISDGILGGICFAIDTIMIIFLVMSTKHMKIPFSYLFFVVILSCGIGRSLFRNLVNSTIIAAAYLFVTIYGASQKTINLTIMNMAFTVAMFYIFGLIGLAAQSSDKRYGLTIKSEDGSDSSTDFKLEKVQEESDAQQTIISSHKVESGRQSWQVPKSLEDAFQIIKLKDEDSIMWQQRYQNERQMNNTIRLIAHDIATQKDLLILYEDIIGKARRETNCQSAFLMRVEDNKLTVKCYDGTLSEITLRVLQNSEILRNVIVSGNSVKLGSADQKRLDTIVGARERIKSLMAVPLKTHNDPKPFGLIGVANFLLSDDIPDDREEFIRLIAVDLAISIRNIEYVEEVEKMYDQLILALARAIEARDKYTHHHVDRVREFSEKLALALGLPEEDVKLIKSAATLHDVGKLATPDAILRKPSGLDKEEFEIMKQHAKASVDILKDIDTLSNEVLDLVMHHHERYDGKGYPDGLKGENIPLGARIIAVADTFDAMTSDRPYRKGFPVDVALKKMEEECVGTQFDPTILDAFIKMMSKKVMLKKREIVLDSESERVSIPVTTNTQETKIQDDANARKVLELKLNKKGNE